MQWVIEPSYLIHTDYSPDKQQTFGLVKLNVNYKYSFICKRSGSRKNYSINHHQTYRNGWVKKMGSGDYNVPKNYFRAFVDFAVNIVDAPVTWFRDQVVEPNRPTNYWYHRKFQRVPTIDECYRDDAVCFTEANEQFKRDKRVDSEIANILRTRMEQCYFYETPDIDKCEAIKAQYLEAEANWFTKYGDLGVFGTAKDAYMKQKHRMIWERRHGPVGSGMRSKEEWEMPFEKEEEN